MSIILKCGIKIDRALEIIVNSSSSLQIRETLSTILKDIKAGKTISRAFADAGQFALLSAQDNVVVYCSLLRRLVLLWR